MSEFGKRIMAILVIGALLPLAGCATLIRGNTQELSVSSEPKEADVYVNGLARGKTPLMLRLDRDVSYHVELRHPEFGSRVFMINRRLEAGWLILDVLCGLVPIVVDASSGAWYALEPDRIRVSLFESPELLNWKVELARAIDSVQRRKGRPSPDQARFLAMLTNLGITPEEWIYSLDESDYRDFQESGENHKTWLKARIKKAIEGEE